MSRHQCVFAVDVSNVCNVKVLRFCFAMNDNALSKLFAIVSSHFLKSLCFDHFDCSQYVCIGFRV